MNQAQIRRQIAPREWPKSSGGGGTQPDGEGEVLPLFSGRSTALEIYMELHNLTGGHVWQVFCSFHKRVRAKKPPEKEMP